MKNFRQPGNTIDVVAPAGGLVSGQGELFGSSLFGISFSTKVSGEAGVLEVEGVHDVAKLASDVMGLGDKVNWNNATHQLQNATSTLDNVATVVEAAAASTTTVKVKLTPV